MDKSFADDNVDEQKPQQDEAWNSIFRTTTNVPQHISEPLEHQARHIFLQDTIVLTPNSSGVSQGHFANLAGLLNVSGESEALPCAVNAVALASLANRFGVLDARTSAAQQYSSCLRQIRAQMLASNRSMNWLVASISLLSLYEILNADTIDTLNCVTHLRGIMAIIRDQNQLGHLPTFGVESLILSTDAFYTGLCRDHDASTRAANSSGGEIEIQGRAMLASLPIKSLFDDLVSIFARVASLFKKATSALQPKCIRLEAQLAPLRLEASSLGSALLAWQAALPTALHPLTVRRFTQPYFLSFPDCRRLHCPTLRADSYTDYLVANVWTSYRQCQLHLTDLIQRLNNSLTERSSEGSNVRREQVKLQNDMVFYTDDVFASVLYMLVGESIHYWKPDGANWQLPRPPMLLGGLNMQWALFTIATLENSPAASKIHARDISSWFGEVLGIGQAKVLAHMQENPPGGITAKGDALRWSGFLL